MRITPSRANLLLGLIVTVEIAVALALVSTGHHLSWPQLIAVTGLPWLVGLADRQGWLWRDRALERWVERQDRKREREASERRRP